MPVLQVARQVVKKLNGRLKSLNWSISIFSSFRVFALKLKNG